MRNGFARRVNGDEAIADASVIVPAYNAVNTISRALNSVAAQTLLPREVLVVDDCSSDETVSVVEKLATTFPNLTIKLVKHSRNRGPASARNTGWNMATSRYVAFIDADDSWHPRKLEIQYQWMKTHPDAVLCGHGCPDLGGRSHPKIDIEKIPARRASSARFLLSSQFSTPTAMVTRDISYRFEEGKRYCEDYLLWLQIVLDRRRVDCIDLPLAATHKPLYGAGGLSARLWLMERGELDVYRRLNKEGRIGGISMALLFVWSASKYLRRCAAVIVRRAISPLATHATSDR